MERNRYHVQNQIMNKLMKVTFNGNGLIKLCYVFMYIVVFYIAFNGTKSKKYINFLVVLKNKLITNCPATGKIFHSNLQRNVQINKLKKTTVSILLPYFYTVQ